MDDNKVDEKLREKASNNFGKEYKKTNIDKVIFLARDKKKKIFMYKSIACSVCVFILLGVFIYFNNLNNIGSPVVDNKANNETTTNIDIDHLNTILYEIPNEHETSDVFPSYIAVIKINEIEDLGIVNFLPETNIRAEVVENIKGDLNKSSIEFKVDESIILTDEIPSKIKEKIKYEEKDSYIRLVVDEKMINSSYPEKEKYYIISLIIENETLKVLNHCKYPFNEFNIENRKVKVGKEWIDFNI